MRGYQLSLRVVFPSAFAFNEALLARSQEQSNLLSVCAPNITPNHWQAHLKPRADFKHFKDRLMRRGPAAIMRPDLEDLGSCVMVT